MAATRNFRAVPCESDDESRNRVGRRDTIPKLMIVAGKEGFPKVPEVGKKKLFEGRIPSAWKMTITAWTSAGIVRTMSRLS